MKKIIAMALILVLCLELFTACGTNDFVGVWESQVVSEDDVGMSQPLKTTMYITLTIAKDKSYEMVAKVVPDEAQIEEMLLEELDETFQALGLDMEEDRELVEHFLGMTLEEYLEASMGDTYVYETSKKEGTWKLDGDTLYVTGSETEIDELTLEDDQLVTKDGMEFFKVQ